MKFQQDKHLKKIDGIVGPETWGAICDSLLSISPTDMIKETKHRYHQIVFVAPTDAIQEKLGTIYHQVAFEQENPSEPQLETPNSLQDPEENETDFPVGDFQALTNLTEAELEHLATNAMTPPENATQAATRANATIPGEQAPANQTVPPENVTPPIIEAPATNVTAPPPTGALGEQPICTDGNSPDSSTGLCADGFPPVYC